MTTFELAVWGVYAVGVLVCAAVAGAEWKEARVKKPWERRRLAVYTTLSVVWPLLLLWLALAWAEENLYLLVKDVVTKPPRRGITTITGGEVKQDTKWQSVGPLLRAMRVKCTGRAGCPNQPVACRRLNEGLVVLCAEHVSSYEGESTEDVLDLKRIVERCGKSVLLGG